MSVYSQPLSQHQTSLLGLILWVWISGFSDDVGEGERASTEDVSVLRQCLAWRVSWRNVS